MNSSRWLNHDYDYEDRPSLPPPLKLRRAGRSYGRQATTSRKSWAAQLEGGRHRIWLASFSLGGQKATSSGRWLLMLNTKIPRDFSGFKAFWMHGTHPAKWLAVEGRLIDVQGKERRGRDEIRRGEVR